MSDIMRPMSFEQLLNWTLTEYKKSGTVFGEHHPYHADEKYNRMIFERTLETPVGPSGRTAHPSWRRISWPRTIQAAVSLN